MAELTSKLVKQYNLNPCNEVNQMYNEAVATGFAPGSCCKVQFLGDERAGKTSLRKRLMGEKFDPDEPETFGIDTRMCNVENVNEKWERKDPGDTEIYDCISWFYRNRLRHQKNDSKITTSREMLNLALGMLFVAIFECLLWLCSFVDFPIGTKMRLLVWISCSILFITKNVELYLTMKGSTHTLFTMIVVKNILFTTNNVLPTWTRVVVPAFIAFLQGIIAPCDTRMGQSVFLGWTLLFLPSDTNTGFNEWVKQCDLSLDVVLFFIILGMLPATYPTPTNCSFIAQAVTYHMRCLTKFKHKMTIKCIGALIVFAILIILPLFHESKTPLMFFTLGLWTGIADKLGLSLGHRFMNSKYCIDKILSNWCIWYFISMIYSLVLVSLCCRKTSFQDNEMFRNLIVGVLPLVVGEWQRNKLVDYSLKVADVTRQVEKSTGDKMPLKLSLWDFAGQDLYYNTHHTFISEHAVFVVVFDLVSFVKDATSVCERISFWIDSVKQHSADPSIILAGTHKNSVSHDFVEQANRFLKNCLDTSNIIYNGRLCYFAMDNSNPEDSLDDFCHLRETIKNTARGLKHVSEEYPIKWRGFLNFIIKRRSQSTNIPLIEVSELEKIMHEYRIYSTKELLDMLDFFHKSGDIFYDSVDTFLRQYVAPDQQIIIDIMQSLVSVPDSVMARFHVQYETFQETGSLSYVLLKSIIESRLNVLDETLIQVIIRMLQEKDLIFKIQSSKSEKSKQKRTFEHVEEMFVVPSMLSTISYQPSIPHTWTKHYYIDFGSILPDGVFLRLLSRCAMTSGDFLSDLKALSRQGGIFSLGEHFRFMLRRIQPCRQQHVVEVSVKVVHDDSPLEVVKYMCGILDMLRCRDFPSLHFKVGPLCLHDEPHQGCRYQGMLHVVYISSELMYTGAQTARTGNLIKRQCNGRRVLIPLAEFVQLPRVPGDTSRVDDSDLYCLVQLLAPDDLKKLFYALGLKRQDILKGEISTDSNDIEVKAMSVLQRWKSLSGDRARRDAIIGALEKCYNFEGRDDVLEVWKNKENTSIDAERSDDEPDIDVYISCSKSDKIWVQTHIARFLSDTPHFFTVYINKFGDSSRSKYLAGGSDLHNDSTRIARSRIFLAVLCSRQYTQDASGRLQFEREVARRCGIPILAVSSNGYETSDVPDLFDADCIQLPAMDDRKALEQFQKLLLETIRRV